MPKPNFKALFLATAFTIITTQSRAHVPYFELNDFSAKQPFTVDYSIEQSIAVYAWLDNMVPGKPSKLF